MRLSNLASLASSRWPADSASEHTLLGTLLGPWNADRLALAGWSLFTITAAIAVGYFYGGNTKSCLVTPGSAGRMACAPTVWPFGNRSYAIRIWYKFWCQYFCLMAPV